MTKTVINVLSILLFVLSVAFIFTFMLIFGLALTKFSDFIQFLEDSFINMFNKITNLVVEFFEIFYEDVYDLIVELFGQF